MTQQLSPREGEEARRRRYVPRGHPVSWMMLLVSTLAILITSVDRVILPTLLPAILTEFDLTETQGGFLNSLSFAGTFVGAIVLGVLGDSLGRGSRRAWTWMGTVIVTIIGSVGTFFTNTLGGLQLWRVVMGVGTGGMEPVNVAMVGEWWQKENRGFAVGVHHTGFPIGQFVGPLLIGAIIAVPTWGWREAFLFVPLIAVPIMIAQVVIGRRRNLRRVNEWVREHEMTPSVDAEERPPAFGNPWHKVRDSLSNRNVRLALAVAFLFLWAELGVIAFLTLQLTREVGLSLAQAVVISGASGLTGWIGQIVWGTLSDGLGRKFSLNIIAIGWTISVLAMIFISSAATAWIILIGWGLFRNSPFPVLYALILDSVPESASSGMGLTIGIALGLSGLIVSTVAGFFVQNFGFTWDYIMLASACLLALIPIAMLRETVDTAVTTAGRE